MKTSALIDISPPLSPQSPTWPGDTPFSQHFQMTYEAGHHLALSSIHTTVHIGAHADAPSHYHPEGKTMDEVDLAPYFGECVVIDARDRLCLDASLALPEVLPPRVLFKTDSFEDFEKTPEFSYFDPALIRLLAKKNVRLIGIDTPSMDPLDSKEMPAHQCLYEEGLLNLEGLCLRQVEPKTYWLSALPLRIVKSDASPVRAVLVEWDPLG